MPLAIHRIATRGCYQRQSSPGDPPEGHPTPSVAGREPPAVSRTARARRTTTPLDGPMSKPMTPLVRSVAHNLARLLVVSASAVGMSVAVQADAHAVGGRTFFLSPSGSDASSGTDASHPFRSLEKVSDG